MYYVFFEFFFENMFPGGKVLGYYIFFILIVNKLFTG